MKNSEKSIIESIRFGNRKEMYPAIEKIYDLCFYSIRNYVLRNNGSEDDAKDVFQDGITILYRNIMVEQFKEQSSIKTYLYSICKNVWLQKMKGDNADKSVSLDGFEDLKEESDFTKIDTTTLNSLIVALTGDCRKLLLGFYYEKMSIGDLTRTFQLGSEQATRNKKFRCMENLIKLVRDREMTIENFLL